MPDGNIRIVEVQETNFGEKVIVDSPFDAKDYIKFLPWAEYQEEVEEHGSLEGKAQDRGTNTKTSELQQVFDAMEEFGFSDDFSTHVSWEPDALGGEGAWSIDVDAVPEAKDFWEFVGFDVNIDTQLP